MIPPRLRPSSAARLVMCPGSRALCEAFLEEDGIEAREGTAAHWAAAQLLTGHAVAIGQVAENGVTLTDEMIDGAELYADHIKARGPVGNVEVFIQNDAVHPTENGGTPDHFSYVVSGSRLIIYVDDFKFGHGYIGVFRCWQLLNYAALILRSIQETWHDDSVIDFVFTIVQPRNFHRDGPIRTWSVPAIELRPLFNIMNNQYAVAMRDDAQCVATDPDICANCSGRHACEAATAASWNSVPMAYSSTPLVMSSAAIGLETRILRKAIKRMEARLDGLEQQALSTIVRGKTVPGFSIEHGLGRTVWIKPVADIVALGVALGVDFSKNEAITPTQAIKAMKVAGLPPEMAMVLDPYKFAPPGAAKLVQDDGSTASKIFNQRSNTNG